jgi:bifunctional UDP-N-acetylglucosamine pyrophosphorylase/glucosamine-1-phosphate N-acetyltransferase
MTDLHIVILAAGKGTRMKSALPKVLHRLAGRPLVEHVLDTVSGLGAATTVLVVGHGADAVRTALAYRPHLQYAVQSPQLGTGHALLQTAPVLEGRTGTVLLLYADVPLLTSGTLALLLERHRQQSAAATVLTAELADPYGYGRVVRDAEGQVERIVEERDASAKQRAVREINTGIYALELEPLFEALRQLATDNAQGEYYLTDLVAIYRRQSRRVATLCIDDAAEIRGVNSRIDLAELARIVFDRKRRELMLAGVTLEDPDTAYVESTVEIGADTIIGPGVTLTGSTVIGAGCRIGAGVRIANSTVADGVIVLDHSVIVESTVEADASVGPFAHLRPGSEVGPGARVGNFVELKKTSLGPGAKAGHLAYLGDATIGADVNIGAGVITCNFDGVRKHKSTVEDGAFVGSDSQLIAPVTIGRGAYVAAGSTVTEDVPPGALAIGRGRQVNKPDWAARREEDRRNETAHSHGPREHGTGHKKGT